MTAHAASLNSVKAASGDADLVVRALAGRPIIPGPGQELLDELVGKVLAGNAV